MTHIHTHRKPIETRYQAIIYKQKKCKETKHVQTMHYETKKFPKIQDFVFCWLPTSKYGNLPKNMLYKVGKIQLAKVKFYFSVVNILNLTKLKHRNFRAT